MKFTCKVIKGKGRGKTLGFPTFNLQVPKDFSTKEGIYACWVWLSDKKYRGALHYGTIPVFNDDETKLEIFVLDYSFDAPTHQLTFQLVKFLRPVKKFSSPKILMAQIRQDVEQIRHLLSN